MDSKKSSASIGESNNDYDKTTKTIIVEIINKIPMLILHLMGSADLTDLSKQNKKC